MWRYTLCGISWIKYCITGALNTDWFVLNGGFLYGSNWRLLPAYVSSSALVSLIVYRAMMAFPRNKFGREGNSKLTSLYDFTESNHSEPGDIWLNSCTGKMASKILTHKPDKQYLSGQIAPRSSIHCGRCNNRETRDCDERDLSRTYGNCFELARANRRMEKFNLDEHAEWTLEAAEMFRGGIMGMSDWNETLCAEAARETQLADLSWKQINCTGDWYDFF